MSVTNRVFEQCFRLERRTLLPFGLILISSVVAGAAVAQQPLLVVAVISVILLGVGMLIWPEVSTLAMIFILYTNAAVVAVRFHGLPYTVGAATPLLLTIPLATYLVFQRRPLVINSVVLLLAAFLVVQMVGTLLATNFNWATKNLMTLIVEGLMLYVLLINVIRTPETLRRVIWILLFAGALMGGLSIYQQVTGTFDNNYGGFAQIDGVGFFKTGAETLQGKTRQLRLAGPIGEKNYYAQIMLMLVPVGLFMYWGERSPSLRGLAIVATGLAATGAALTFSRGAAVGFVLVLIITGFMRYLKPRQIVIILLGIVLLFQAVPQFGQRMVSLQALSGVTQADSEGIAGTDRSTQGRLGEMWAAGLVVADHPVIGVGPGMFKFYYARYAESIGLRVHSGEREAHNQFLDIAAETGLLGLGFFLAIMFVTLRGLAQARKQWGREHPGLASIATGLMLAIIAYEAAGLFLSMAYMRYFWLMMALAGAASHLAAVSVIADDAEDANPTEWTPTLTQTTSI